jgi:Zn-dependent protease with chaperone function
MPISAHNGPVLAIAILASLLIGLMLGQGWLTAWELWRATRRLNQATQTAGLPLPPVVAKLATKLYLTDTLAVVSGGTPFSFCYGFWRPRICLSLGLIELLNEAELEAVLRHEAYHLDRREPLRLAIAIGLSRFFFFVPLLAELRDYYLVEKELAADAAAITHTGRAALAGALHKLVAVTPSFTLPPLVAGLSVTVQRVDYLLDPRPRRGWTPSRRSILGALALFTLGCLLMMVGLI